MAFPWPETDQAKQGNANHPQHGKRIIIGSKVFKKARLHHLATWPGKQVKALLESNNSLNHIAAELTLGVLGCVGYGGVVIVILDNVFSFQHYVLGEEPASGN